MKKVSKDSTKWFRAKSYGWGRTPNTWQGWTVMGVWLSAFLAVTITPQVIFPDSIYAAIVASIGGLFTTGILLIITYRTGESPAWRWGRTSNKK